ncbi:MAG: branched-chain amino acid ABC transporter permease [Bacillota bacterium]
MGSVYSLMAVGYSLVYSIMNFSNFAHGGVIMVGSYIGFYLLTSAKVPFPAALLGAAAGAGVLAIIVERIAYSPLRHRSAPFLYFIISAMGASMFIENFVVATIGPTFKTYPAVFSRWPIEIGPFYIGRIDVLIFVSAAMCLLGLVYFIDRTKLGKAVQATSFNHRAASLMGVNTGFVITLVFAIGGLLAGIAGVLFGMKYTVYPQMGAITIKSFIAAVFGGLGSLPGAVIGSLLLGIIETLVSGYFSSQYRDLISFTLLIAVLIFRPIGLMGKVTEEKA